MKETVDKSVQNTESLIEQSKAKALLGFRTNKTWKKVLSIVYLVFCVLFAFYAIIGERKGQVTVYDYWINKASYIVLAFSLFCPYIFLSNTKFRDKLPLFKKHSTGASIGGLLIVFVALIIVFGIVNSAHSAEYKADMKNHAYTVISSKDATCETDGEIISSCDYCGKENTEIVAKLGHNMTEITRKEATENEDGKIVNKCSVCGKEETITLEKLTQKKETTKATKATEKKNESTTRNQTELITEKATVEKTTKATTVKSTTIKTTTEVTTKTPTEPITEFKWKSAIGNLYNGVELYIVTEDKASLYGVVTEYDTTAHRVQVYLVEGDTFMWFPTREVSFLNQLKVRSDDPHLPENR